VSGVAGKIEAIFRLCREGESDRLLSCGVDLNHRLLFHGSSSSNLISILSRGLLIAPPEAPASGYLFGKVCVAIKIYLSSFFDTRISHILTASHRFTAEICDFIY